jgi:hypothetical protein
MQEFLLMAAYKKKLAKIENEIKLDMAKEVDLLMREGLSYEAALRQVKEMYEKAHSLTDQSVENEPMKLLNKIIPPGTDIDNDQIYIEENGQVLRDL